MICYDWDYSKAKHNEIKVLVFEDEYLKWKQMVAGTYNGKEKDIHVVDISKCSDMWVDWNLLFERKPSKKKLAKAKLADLEKAENWYKENIKDLNHKMFLITSQINDVKRILKIDGWKIK